MKTIVIKTQAELDALPDSFTEYTVIEIRSDPAMGNIIVRKARGSSRVEARESSRVEARESSRVEARESSSVVARESSSVEAWESSSVEAWESSRVVARGSSSVVARGSSSVVARGSVSVHAYSENSTILLCGYCVAWLFNKAKATLKSKTARKIVMVTKEGVPAWLEREGVDKTGQNVILFKRVSAGFLTQEETSNETHWKVGTTLSHPSPDLKRQECGEGKYHFCSRPYFCDEFRNTKQDDKYIALSVPVKSLYAFPGAQYPHKISALTAKVLYVCNRFGDEIK